MAGSQTQRHTTAAGHKTPNPAAAAAAATTAQPPPTPPPPTPPPPPLPTSTGAQHAQDQTLPEDQVSDGFTEESPQHSSGAARSRRRPSDVTSQLVLLSDTNAGEGSSQDWEPSCGETVSNTSWVMEQFWADEGNVPIWARPMHASERAARAHGIARVLPIIADFDSYVALFQRPR